MTELMSPSGGTPPHNQQTPSGTAPVSDQWIMKALTDIRSDLKEHQSRIDRAFDEVSGKISTTETRISAIESKITKLIWVVGTVGAVITLIWGGYEFVTGFVDIDISITPKK